MVLGLGVGAYSAALFHLLTHAFFKACLFLGSGAIIHAMHHEQDMRWMGGLSKKMPWTFVTFTIATLALAGLPLTSGFMSKDAILAGALGFAEVEGGGIYYLIPVLGFFSAMLTAFYMGRQIWLVFFGKSRTHLKPADEHHGHDDHAHHEVHEVSWAMRLPLVVLASLSVFAVFSPDPLDGAKGWFMHLVQTPETVVVADMSGSGTAVHHEAGTVMKEVAHEDKPDVLHGQEPHEGEADHVAAHTTVEADHGDALATEHGDEHHGPVFSDPRQAAIAHAAHENHDPAIMYSSIMVALGIGLALIVYVFGFINPEKTAQRIRPLYLYSFNKWYWDEIYDATVIKGSMLIANLLSWFDRNIVDGLVNGVGATVRKFGFASGGFDHYVVDGLVNFTAFFVQTSGAAMKKIQTGKVQTYLVMALLAVTGYIVYYYVQLM